MFTSTGIAWLKVQHLWFFQLSAKSHSIQKVKLQFSSLLQYTFIEHILRRKQTEDSMSSVCVPFSIDILL